MSYLTPSSAAITQQEDHYPPTTNIMYPTTTTATTMVKNQRTKCLAFAPTNNHVLVSGHTQSVRLYSGPLRSNDVVVGAINIGGAHLKPPHLQQYPGNQKYLSLLCQQHTAFIQASGFDRRAIVSLIQEELRKADPPARFIVSRFGIDDQQWVGMNGDQVVKLIQRDLLHNLVAGTTTTTTSPPPANYDVIYNNSNTHPQQSHHQRTLPLRIVSPVVFEQDNNGGNTGGSTTNHVPAVMSSNVAEFLQLPCMAVQRSRLSDYNQGLLNSLELFQATELDVLAWRKGKKAITLGQLGLRCRHCATAAEANGGSASMMSSWSAYSVSFPGRIQVMEFNYFMIAAKHFVGGACVHIPHELRSQILSSKRMSASQTKKRGGTGIQGYLSQVAFLCGIQDTPGGMKLPVAVVEVNDEEEAFASHNAAEDGAAIVETSAGNNSDETTKESMMLADVVETPMAQTN